MLTFPNWLLSLSFLLALSSFVNGAFLPPPDAWSPPILKRDGSQPVRRQDCAVPGLDVDQEQVTHSPSTSSNYSFANVDLSEKSCSQTYAIRIRKMISSPDIVLCELIPMPPSTSG